MIILASNSATRKSILDSWGLEYKITNIDFDEDILTYTKPQSFVYYATEGKMQAFLNKNHKPEFPVVCADTVVSVNAEMLRKAKDKNSALEMLLKQSGNTVSIFTYMKFYSSLFEYSDLSVTHYNFDIFDKQDLEKYLDTELWKDKAGACMVEGFCKPYIRSVVGYESTAMGLCIEKLIKVIDFYEKEFIKHKQ